MRAPIWLLLGITLIAWALVLVTGMQVAKHLL